MSKEGNLILNHQDYEIRNVKQINEALKNETSYIKETHLKIILLKLNVNSIGNIFEPKTIHNCGETKADSESKDLSKM